MSPISLPTLADLIYYSYNQFGEYVGFGVSRPSPMEPGVYLLPGGATRQAPPDDIPEEHIALYDRDTDGWTVVPDHRGIYISTIDKSLHEITQPGVLPDPAWTQQPLTDRDAEWDAESGSWQVSLETLKGRKSAELATLVEQAYHGLGEQYGIVEQATWPQQLAGARDLQDDPESTTTAAQYVRSLAQALDRDLVAFVESILTHVSDRESAIANLLVRQKQYQEQINAAPDAATLEAIIITLD